LFTAVIGKREEKSSMAKTLKTIPLDERLAIALEKDDSSLFNALRDELANALLDPSRAQNILSVFKSCKMNYSPNVSLALVRLSATHQREETISFLETRLIECPGYEVSAYCRCAENLLPEVFDRLVKSRVHEGRFKHPDHLRTLLDIAEEVPQPRDSHSELRKAVRHALEEQYPVGADATDLALLYRYYYGEERFGEAASSFLQNRFQPKIARPLIRQLALTGPDPSVLSNILVTAASPRVLDSYFEALLDMDWDRESQAALFFGLEKAWRIFNDDTKEHVKTLFELVVKQGEYGARHNSLLVEKIESLWVLPERGGDEQAGPRDGPRITDTGSYYDLITQSVRETAQAMEFIAWLQDKHPNLDILASVPVAQLREIVAQFCEQKHYSNAASFSSGVIKWLKGDAEPDVSQVLINLGTAVKIRNDTYRSDVAPFERYQTVPYHAMFLFLSVGNFPGFINENWEDLNPLTGDNLDIYYSYEDLERSVSAFEVVEQFRSISVDLTKLPAILLWGKSLSDSGLIPLERLSDVDVVDIMKLIVQRIKEEKGLQEICREANELVKGKMEALAPGTKITVGDVQISTFSNVGQAVVVGSDAHDMTFNQYGNPIALPIDLSRLAEELSTLRQAMKKEAIEPEQDEAVAEVGKAERAAKAKDASKVAEYLKSAGKWALDIAKAVGVPLATEALKKSLGM